MRGLDGIMQDRAPSETKAERVSILDDTDLPQLLAMIVLARDYADKTSTDQYVIRNGVTLGITSVSPHTAEGKRLGARYLMRVHPLASRMPSQEIYYRRLETEVLARQKATEDKWAKVTAKTRSRAR